jgi:hypothetical protein
LFTNVSKEHTASIFSVGYNPEGHIPKDHKPTIVFCHLAFMTYEVEKSLLINVGIGQSAFITLLLFIESSYD